MKRDELQYGWHLLNYNNGMDILNSSVREVIENAEVVTIATCGANGPHLVATWGDYVRSLGIKDGKTIVIPAGGYLQTEKNLEANDRVELLVASKKVQGKSGPGTGYRLSGRAKMVKDGELMDLTKSKFSWARGAFVIEVENAEQLL
ncbi:MAG: pyridoxamine 5'-phosphate oxidase family protein [Anaerolineaceae bacterium]|nr:pyridoxamine 5'-phosphate oxidase family protein [Anaerolineaceae bacterium]